MTYRIFTPYSLFTLTDPCFLVGYLRYDVKKADRAHGQQTRSESNFSRETIASVFISSAVPLKCHSELKPVSKSVPDTLVSEEEQIVGVFERETNKTSRDEQLELATSGLRGQLFVRLILNKDFSVHVKEVVRFGQKMIGYDTHVFLFDPFDFGRALNADLCPSEDVVVHLFRCSNVAQKQTHFIWPTSTIRFYEQKNENNIRSVAVDVLCRFVSFFTETIQMVYVKRHWNVLLAIIVDVTLGILITLILYHFFTADTLLDLSLKRTEFIVSKLKDLLKWMMGSPAGLKLNYPLNYSLGTFFLFHIYLWQEYLSVLQATLKCILQVLLWTGVFGLTFQLSLLQDLLALSTFHIYCFYAYAAKIYHLNFAGLASFWRLFRGKKWNPLRERIDSCSYSADQLFLGTLSLTVLLFLIPTTFLYYVVFTTLRLGVLFIQGSIQKIITAINNAPLSTLILFGIKSKLLIDGIEVAVVSQQRTNTSLVFTIKGAGCSWEKACSTFQYPVTTVKEKLLWSNFIKNVIVGNVIYPL